MNNLHLINSCPWSNLTPDTLQFCEERLCSWIVSPAETWSNLAYILVGIIILKKFKELKIFGSLALMVGLCSFIYHATHIYWTETLDLSAMNLLGSLLISLNVKRLIPNLSEGFFKQLFFFLVFASCVFLLLLTGTNRLHVFGSMALLAVILEMILFLKNKTNEKIYYYKWYFVTLGLFILSFIFWQLDFQKILCDPKNHFVSGHALWHIVNSLCFYSLARFYHERL